MARSYAPDLIVPAVPMTPMRPASRRRDRGARAGLDDADHRQRTARRASVPSACAVAVLQAMTIALTS